MSRQLPAPAGRPISAARQARQVRANRRWPLRVDIPRDRDGCFDPILMPKHQRRFTGLNNKIIAIYVRGMTMRREPSLLAHTNFAAIARAAEKPSR
ncbi:protein of unknown function (plasmid) [Cupriavidus taiwanensis]|uniref:Transposase n=1 Tax=Cupriavidus taiwanensis TaxID=164546 RepID=A0A375IVQ7_9BURK|nr:protein of unknown function [Cupriavidus taiwanensis]